MFLYKIEIELQDQLLYLIVAAESEEKAFSYVDSHMDRHFLKSPDKQEVSIVEKKRLDQGAGYVIETHALG
ncbi:hypothetical protein BVG16_01950 [Paenibacillus selenitireducens]|jgi:hypothetical protein|uniref:DUF3906 domain-containing protein n=1 Tax=Paenibacillus selenitireducens TaxID=1324314 RepID=A0A1T2XMT7_9BACL|nr:DUF3906 family protein [Paenibacillus selenitireducens]OPA81125.1 hypothetical protein BVG16_01950 [Paenibacillus selenitireducens]